VKLMSDEVENFDQGYEGYGYGYEAPMESRTATSEGSAAGGRRYSGRISWVDLGRA
jgi:hypothetical protein